ncbi:cytochrome P450 [Smaragdicoccus niigatensis]|uniref:cytochrome P450 n=1 Tax=Smaragdicoccus niigatensis TaxID=359359 RepID=UPI000374E6FA|nr:cytochrome P450 [Smaragdicoccus niigatensis]
MDTLLKVSAPPQLDDIPMVSGDLPMFTELAGRPYAMPLDLLAERYGPIFQADVNGNRMVMVCSREMVNELCDESRFNKEVTSRLMRVRPLAGDGLFTAFRGEPNWQKAHDVLISGFSYNGLRSYHPALLDINVEMTRHWDAAIGNHPVDVSLDLTKLAMDSVALAGFGARFDSFSQPGFSEIPMAFLIASLNMPPLGNPETYEAARAKLFAFVDQMVVRHQNPQPGDLDDLMNLMIAPGPDGQMALDIQTIRNESFTFLVAGQITTSILMPTTLYSLVKNPYVLHRVQAEVDSVFGTEDDYLPSYDDMGKLTYLRQCIDETLRLSPPVPFFDRMALEDTVIGGRYPIHQGESFTVLTGGLHRQPEWGDNVEQFDPDRFLPENVAARPEGLFRPFGTGPRACIGRQFALHEATMTIARIVHRYRLVDSGHYVLNYATPTERKPNGFKLDLIRRTPAERHQAAPSVAPTATAAPPAASALGMVKAGTTLAVLHGSNLGTCQALAKHLVEDAADWGCTATVAPLDDAVAALPAADVTVIVASSYNGQPTDDARNFYNWLGSTDATLEGTPLYAVLGVGDRNWSETYQAVPKRIDARLAEMGAERLLPRTAADVAGDFAGTIDEFSVALRAALVQRFGDPNSAPKAAAPEESLYEVRKISGSITDEIDARFEVQPMTVLENNELVAPNDLGPGKRHIRIALPEGVEYQTGDHLTVLADNPPELVNLILEAGGIDPDMRLSINPRRSSRRLIAVNREVTARELLTHFVELRKAATPTQLRRLAASNPCPPERQRLEELADSSTPSAISPLECLVEFPACTLRGPDLLELLDPMTPRHYSISSSSRLSPQIVALIVSVLQAPARSGRGMYKGVASNHLAEIAPGTQIRARVDRAREAFRSGSDPARNVILVSAGTGVAPFCGFLMDRFAAKMAGDTYTQAMCFFGVNDPDVDYIFRKQFERGVEEGIVDMRPAFSHTAPGGIRFVQDRIAADADDVWNLIGDPEKNAYVYVCGDGARMAPGVRQAFLDIYRARTGADEAAARDWMVGLVQSDRYVEDVFAG